MTRQYDPGTTYILTESDILEGIYVTDHLTGRTRVIGRTNNGMKVNSFLHVKLCTGCDKPMDAGVCHDCEIYEPLPDELTKPERWVA